MYYLELSFTVSGHETPADLEKHLDAVLEQLYADARIEEPDYVVELGSGSVTLNLCVDTSEPSDAFIVALGATRAAVHCAEGATPGWEAHFEYAESVIRRSSVSEVSMTDIAV